MPDREDRIADAVKAAAHGASGDVTDALQAMASFGSLSPGEQDQVVAQLEVDSDIEGFAADASVKDLVRRHKEGRSREGD